MIDCHFFLFFKKRIGFFSLIFVLSRYQKNHYMTVNDDLLKIRIIFKNISNIFHAVLTYSPILYI